MVCTALTETAKDVLGREWRMHPDKFKENIESMEPLHTRNQLYLKYVSSRSETDRLRFAASTQTGLLSYKGRQMYGLARDLLPATKVAAVSSAVPQGPVPAGAGHHTRARSEDCH